MRRIKLAAPILLILLQDVLYGFGDPISKRAYESVPVYSLLAARYWIALAFLALLFGGRILRELRGCSWRALILPSLCMAMALLLSNSAIKLTAATAVAFLRSTSTILTPLLALVVYRRRYPARHIPVLLFMLVGLYLFCGPGGLSSFGFGEMFALASALMTAGALLFAGEAVHRVSPITLTAMQTAASAVLTTGCALIFDGGIRLSDAGAENWAVIFYLAILCTTVGYLLQNSALKRIPASTVALLQCAYPVMTAAFSFLLLGERLTAAGTAGALIILACVAAETILPSRAQGEGTFQ